MDPRHVVNELQGIVVVGVRAFGAISNPTVIDQRDVGDSPRHRYTAFEVWNAYLADDIGVEGQISADGIEEPGISEPRFVDQVRRNGASVGAHVLLVVRHDLGAVQSQTLVGLVLIAPAIASGPLRLR